MKKNKKSFQLLLLIGMLALFVTGCSAKQTGTPPTSGLYYWIYQLFGHPIQNIMIALSHQISGANGAGWAIAIITAIVRLILMPFMLSTQKKSIRQQEKMSKVQPQMKLIQNAMKTNGIDQQQQLKLSALQQRVLKENNMSMFGGMGCLPLLIQFPIMIGIYQAVAYSKPLAETSFFGISLGQRSLVLTIVATALYAVQSYLSLIGIPEEQKKTMQSMLLLNPLMTFFISVSTPGALALYFLIGGVIAIIQQLITTFLVQPQAKKEIAHELDNNPIKEVVTPQVIQEILKSAPRSTSESTPSKQDETIEHERLRKRNAGKQKRRNDHD